ncbi:hypothetical protein GDO81_014404, partial [Engystomops pustulosus]
QDNVLLSPETFTDLVLYSVEQETEDTCRYRFRLPSGTSLGLQLGQHLVLRGMVDGAEVQRAYTPITPGDRKTHFEVLIK